MLRVPGFCAGNSPVTGEFPAQKDFISIWWRHHVFENIPCVALLVIL